MKIYAIEQSENEVKKAYSFLIDRINEHVKLLAENSKPITSIMGIKRALHRLRLNYIEKKPKEEIRLSESLELLANEVLDKYNVDIKDVIDIGLVGEKEIKRALVKKEYEEMAKQNMTYKVIKAKLSKRYGLSVSSIEKLVYRKSTYYNKLNVNGEIRPLSLSGTYPKGEDNPVQKIKAE
jgi:hypothetical protein